VSWPLLWLVGVVVATLVTPHGWILVALAVFDASLLVVVVARRIEPPGPRRMVLLRWLSSTAQYYACGSFCESLRCRVDSCFVLYSGGG